MPGLLMWMWGFDKAGFPDAKSLIKFLVRNKFEEISHGYLGSRDYVITYFNPDGVAFITGSRGYDNGSDTGSVNDGYLHYVGITAFTKTALMKVLNDFKRNATWEDESPNSRDFI